MPSHSVRQVSRVILLDRSNNVLLVRYDDSNTLDTHLNEVASYWVPPGGALKTDEDWRSAAKRELWEESGLEVEVGPQIWEKKHRLWVSGKQFLQEELFFLAVIEADQPPVANQSSEDIVEVRWWSLVELHNSTEVFFPEGFVSHLADILKGDLSSRPRPI